MPTLLFAKTIDGVQSPSDQISAEIPDWSREVPRQFWDPGRKLLRVIRRYQVWSQRAGLLPAVIRKSLVFRHRFWSVVAGTDIPLNCQIGGGLLIPHPNGIVIHPDAKIGVNCLIFQQVTLGSRGRGGVPEIAGHVDIGAGAKILGSVKIGAHARIGANAVVIADVEPYGVATGYPAGISSCS
jgi:serine O-acetyltransferase